jgi:hypothetical protein
MKLVNNAREAWRWYSVQALAVAAALQGGWLALGDMQSRVPDWAVDGLTLAILVSGIVGRLVDQGGEDD